MGFFRTIALLSLLTGILLAVGLIIGGTMGLTFALSFALLMNFFAYWYSDKIVLSMYGAKEVTKSEAPILHEMVEKLVQKAKLPKPRVCIIKSFTPNAFATGRSPKHSAVAVTTGLLNSLSSDEIEGVIGHELAHIKARDTLTSTIAATIGAAIAYLGYMAWYSLFWSGGRREGGNMLLLPLLILAPLAATLIRMAISRGREFEADRASGLLTEKPLNLASALRKISLGVREAPMTGNSATSHLFIVNPFRADSFSNLFSTHPPLSERIARLEELSKKIP
jgi:heat shock protein HtpX